MWGNQTAVPERMPTPHWLVFSPDLSKREAEMLLRMNTMMRILALDGRLPIMQIGKRLKAELHETIGYGRVYEYVRKLEQNGAIIPVGRGSRNGALYQLNWQMTGYLYFQHFLTLEDIQGAVLQHTDLGSLLTELKIPPARIQECIESTLSANLLTLKAGRHFQDRVFDTTPDYTNQVKTHLEQTLFRDVTLALFELAVDRVIRKPKQVGILRIWISRSSHLKVLSFVMKRALRGVEVRFAQLKRESSVLNQLSKGGYD